MKSLPFYPQQHPESCVPACLRMVLERFDVARSESELYDCCQTDIDGTLPFAAARCAESLGFIAASVRLADLDALLQYVDEGYLHPIVFVNLTPLLGLNVLHAVVIDQIDTEADTIRIVDPAHPPEGTRIWSLALFARGWRMARGQTILIRP